MQYRTFGKTGVEISALGFGMMRLPILGEDSAAIDEELATTMLHHAIDAGLNYSGTKVTNGATTINVYGAQGQSEKDLADLVMQKIEKAKARQGAIYG